MSTPYLLSKYFFKIGDNNYLVETLRQFLYSRIYLKQPWKKVCSTVFDSAMQAMLVEYRKFHRLDVFDIPFGTISVLDEDTYLQIGTELNDAQIALAAVHDPLVRLLLYGNPCSDWETIEPVIPKSKFIGWGHAGIEENCFDYCTEQLRVVGRSMKSPNWGDKTKMNAHIYQLYLVSDVAGMKKGAQGRQFVDGIKYVKQALKDKIPVVAGVDDGDGSPNKDKVTDHFVVIVGMGTDATGNYFRFYDNATSSGSHGTSEKNKLYVNCVDFVIDGKADNSYAESTQYKSYRVTQIRETK